MHIHREIISNVLLFSNLFDYEYLILINKLKLKVYIPGEVIFEPYELIFDMFFI